MSVSLNCRYTRELRCSLAHGPSGATMETDAPKDNAGRGETFSPTDLVAAALLSCAITTMAIKAAKENIPFETADGRVEKHMSSEGPRRIQELTIEIRLPRSLSEAHRSRLEEIARTCPVALSLAPSVAMPMRFVYA